ncbi:hypothetical protein OHC33_003409 [Knufia fluminis]|uniref:Uncharacterized protein n=1 Tax=Knufia fluminis TaxID=191047 RepID=A0AAN8F3E6_9EURO|nr:hypothetical protein OHC33_003409 [Knufia fluminis]
MATPTAPSLPFRRERRILPLPTAILPSQSVARGACLACGKQTCKLSSHRQFSKLIFNNVTRKESQADATSNRTPRQSAAIPVSALLTPDKAARPPLLINAEQEHLLDLWSRPWSPIDHTRNHTLEAHLFPTPLINRLLPVARAHPPLLQALLAYSGTLCATTNAAILDMAFRQQAYAVETLSLACPTEKKASTDEAMLAATLLMLVYLAQGNDIEVQKHASGLMHLTTLRGGLHYLGLGGLVSDMLMYADAMQAVYFNTMPVWTIPLPPLDIGSPSSMGSGFRNMSSLSQEIATALLIAVESVCEVADILEWAGQHPSEPLPRVTGNSFGYLSMIALYQLARCNAAYHDTATVNECVCLVLILFHHVVLRSDGVVTPAILKVEHLTWQALERAEREGLIVGLAPRLYMWMCLMGVTVSVLLPDGRRSQFWSVAVEKLRRVRIKAAVTGWEGLRRDVLDQFCWVSVVQEDVFRRLWIEVEGLESDGVDMNRGTLPSVKELDLLPPPGG